MNRVVRSYFMMAAEHAWDISRVSGEKTWGQLTAEERERQTRFAITIGQGEKTYAERDARQAAANKFREKLARLLSKIDSAVDELERG